MTWVYDPGTLGTYLGELEFLKKILNLNNFEFKIPQTGEYEVFVRKNSIIKNNLNQKASLCFNKKCFILKSKPTEKINKNYILIDKLFLKEGSYELKINSKNEIMNTLAAGDLVLLKIDQNRKLNPPKIEFKRINSIKYRVKLKDTTEPFFLVFNESFHDGWKLYLDSAKATTPIKNDYRDKEIIGSIENRGLPSGKFYETYFKKPIAEDKHFLVNTYANAWWLDLDELEKNGRIKKDEKGNYNFDLIIEFQPQRIFYLSAAISGLALFGCIIYLVFVYSAGKHKAGNN